MTQNPVRPEARGWQALLLCMAMLFVPAFASEANPPPPPAADAPLPGDTPAAAEQIRRPPKPVIKGESRKQKSASARQAKGGKAKAGKGKAAKPAKAQPGNKAKAKPLKKRSK